MPDLSIDHLKTMELNHIPKFLRDWIEGNSTEILRSKEAAFKEAVAVARKRIGTIASKPTCPTQPIRPELQLRQVPNINIKKIRKASKNKADFEEQLSKRKKERKKKVKARLAIQNDYDAKLRNYKKAVIRYKNSMRKWNTDTENKQRAARHQILDNIEKEFAEKLSGKTISGYTKISKLNWEILPRGLLGKTALTAFLNKSGIKAVSGFDNERLDFAFQLNPSAIYVGRNEFNGYFVFVFHGTRKVLLENPFYGNAAYVFSQEWKTLSKLPKTELTQDYDGVVDKIIHSKIMWHWKNQIRLALR